MQMTEEPAAIWDHVLCSEARITEDLKEQTQGYHSNKAQSNSLSFSIILYTRSTSFTKTLSQRQHAGTYLLPFPLSKRVILKQTRVSRTSAISRVGGDTHSPLNQKKTEIKFLAMLFHKVQFPTCLQVEKVLLFDVFLA